MLKCVSWRNCFSILKPCITTPIHFCSTFWRNSTPKGFTLSVISPSSDSLTRENCLVILTISKIKNRVKITISRVFSLFPVSKESLWTVDTSRSTTISFINVGDEGSLGCLGYTLSRLERKIGTPEKSLSDLGLLSCRRYWSEAIMKALLKHRPKHGETEYLSWSIK